MLRTLVFILLVLICFTVFSKMFSHPFKPARVITTLPDTVVKAVEIDLEIARQIGTITVALLAGLASLVLSSEIRLKVTSPARQLLFMVTGLACFCSLFAAHFVYSKMAEMLAARNYNRVDEMISLPKSVQYYGFLIAVASFTALLLSAVSESKQINPRGKGGTYVAADRVFDGDGGRISSPDANSIVSSAGSGAKEIRSTHS